MINRIVLHITRIFISLVFLFSAYSKLYPAEPFELFVFSFGILDWFNSTIAVRVLVGIELFIALLLLLNIYSKRIIQFTILLLSSFTVYLFYVYFFQQDITDCGCFGDKLELSPMESAVKNIVLILVSVFLLIKNKDYSLKYKKPLLIIGTLTTLILPFILSPPDGLIDTELRNKITEKKIDSSIIGNPTKDGQEFSFKKGKAIVCFFSMGCEFCGMTAQKLSIITETYNMDEPIYFVFYGEKDNMEHFWDKSKSLRFPYKIIDTKVFFQYSGSSLPSIMFIEDEEIKKHVGYRALDDKMILDFFKE